MHPTGEPGPLQSPFYERRRRLAAEIMMADGTRFVTVPSTTAESLVKNFERRSFAAIQLEDETVYVNPVHVAYIRET